MNQLINNWVYGEVSPKLGGRFDLDLYWQGCETLQNFRNMLQGGITRRPPLKHVANTVASRLIPFTISSGESYIIELSHKKLRIWYNVAGVLTLATFQPSNNDYLPTNYNQSEIWEVQFAQYYDRIYFAHRNHKQSVLKYSAVAFSFQHMFVSTDEGNDFGKSDNNYPAVVGICQNRLWFASSNANPYTMWVSRPPYDGANNHEDFTTFDEVLVTTEVLKDPEDWPYIKNDKGDDIIDFSDSSKFLEDIDDKEEVINAKCAMEIELASGRNDTIRWISGMQNIIIGTDTNEWVAPFNIDPTRQSASMQSAYGSVNLQAERLHDGVFFITKGNRLCEFSTTEEGASALDLSFSADHILKPGVRQLVSLKYPDTTILCVLNDGTLAVLSYDKRYGMQGWSKWTTDGEFISISTLEIDGIQNLYAVVKRGGEYYLERFDFDEQEHFIDRHNESENGNLSYTSLMVANRFDYNSDNGASLGKSKKASEVWVRCINSGRMSTGVDERYMQDTLKPVGSEDYRIPISGGPKKELKIRIASKGSDPLTLLAMSYEVEVN